MNVLLTVYFNPSDWPDKYVGRWFGVTAESVIVAAPWPAIVAGSFDELAGRVPDEFVWMPRMPDDDPVIVGCFI